MSNLKQIGLGMMMYTEDNDGRLVSGFLDAGLGNSPYDYPNGTTSRYAAWYLAIYPYVKSWDLFNCPSSNTPADANLYYSNQRGWRQDFTYSYNYLRPTATDVITAANAGVHLGEINNGALLSAIEDTAGTIMVLDGSRLLVAFNTNVVAGHHSEETLMARGVCSTTSYVIKCLRARHLGSLNVLFVDGHVKSMQWQKILGDPTHPTRDVLKYWTTAAM